MAAGTRTATAATSRSGFYGTSTAFYTVAARLVDGATALLIAGVAVVVALSSIPLYSLVRQEFVPSDVDEGEFEVSVNAPEGTSLAGDERRDDGASSSEIRSIPGVRMVLALGRRQLPRRASTRARSTCASRRTRSASSRWAGCSQEPGAAAIR